MRGVMVKSTGAFADAMLSLWQRGYRPAETPEVISDLSFCKIISVHGLWRDLST